jgi:hypothetical protein
MRRSGREVTAAITEINAAARRGDVDALVVHLRNQAGSRGLTARGWAARRLGRLRAEPAIPALGGLLHDDDPDVRVTAVEALSRMPDSEAVRDSLASALDDGDALVREHAATGLARLGDARAASALVEMLSAKRFRTRTTGVFGLTHLGDPAHRPLVVAAIKAESLWKRSLMRRVVRHAETEQGR